MLPQVAAVPGIGHEVITSPCAHAAEQIAFRKHRPSVLHLGIFLGHALPVLVSCVLDDVFQQGQMQLAEVCVLNGPVVHLDVDVGVDVAVPGGVGHIVPDTLQIVGSYDAAVAADGQITAVLEVELLQEACLGSVGLGSVVMLDKLLGGACGCSIQVQLHALHVGREVGNVLGQDGVKAFGVCCVRDVQDACTQLGAAHAVVARGGVGGKVGACGQIKDYLAGIAHLQSLVALVYLAADGDDAHAGIVSHGGQLAVEEHLGVSCIT